MDSSFFDDSQADIDQLLESILGGEGGAGMVLDPDCGTGNGTWDDTGREEVGVGSVMQRAMQGGTAPPMVVAGQLRDDEAATATGGGGTGQVHQGGHTLTDVEREASAFFGGVADVRVVLAGRDMLGQSGADPGGDLERGGEVQLTEEENPYTPLPAVNATLYGCTAKVRPLLLTVSLWTNACCPIPSHAPVIWISVIGYLDTVCSSHLQLMRNGRSWRCKIANAYVHVENQNQYNQYMAVAPLCSIHLEVPADLMF